MPTLTRELTHPASRVARRWARIAVLFVRVHADALIGSPLLYLKAVAWRLRGFKVRSRNTIAPLLGASPHAYALWMCRDEATSNDARSPGRAAAKIMILPVIDCREGSTGVDETIASIGRSANALAPVTLGGPPVIGVERVEHPAELKRLISGAGTWLCPLVAGDRLAPNALAAYAEAAATNKAAVIYADDDVLRGQERSEPHFKPRWNPDLFEHHDFVTGASIAFATREALARAPESEWAEQLVGDALRRGEAPVHLPHILHHRRRRPAPIVPALKSNPIAGPVPLVSVIIPTRNHVALLRTCVEGVMAVDYSRVDLIVIDNGSDDLETLDYLHLLERYGHIVLRMPGAFNYSKLNNAGVHRATGDFLCFLNNDVEMHDCTWLSILVQQAMRSDIGAVGARLLYPDRTIQHAGVVIGIGGGAGHAHRFQREDDAGYFDRASLPQQVSAVTAACLVVGRDKFLAVGGYDEVDFPVAFNDVDLCLKLNDAGWQSLYEPRATLIHHESKSRGKDSAKPNRARFAGELAALKRKWHTDTQHDPFHHPHLSRFSERFLVAV